MGWRDDDGCNCYRARPERTRACALGAHLQICQKHEGDACFAAGRPSPRIMLHHIAAQSTAGPLPGAAVDRPLTLRCASRDFLKFPHFQLRNSTRFQFVFLGSGLQASSRAEGSHAPRQALDSQTATRRRRRCCCYCCLIAKPLLPTCCFCNCPPRRFTRAALHHQLLVSFSLF